MLLLDTPRQSENAFKGKIGEIIEHKAVAWLLSVGYEVFKNVTYHGPVDIIAIEPSTGHIRKIDVKKSTDASRYTVKVNSSKLNELQKSLNVEILYYDEINDRFCWSVDEVYTSLGKRKRETKIMEPIPCELDGIHFTSISQAAKYCGISHQQLSAWRLRHPDKTLTDAVVAIKAYKTKLDKGVVVNGVKYASKRDAMNQLHLNQGTVEYWHREKGFGFEDAIAETIRRQSID